MKCVSSCKDGEYTDTTTLECTKCPEECVLCNGEDPQANCTSCSPGFYLAT